jgi:tetraacyldisaccharide 4'-kinase
MDDLATDVGDEPLLLAVIAPVIVSRDRAAGARFAEKNGFDTIIMDDGHQNFSLAKDLSLIVVDAETGFGNNRILPAGPLREPVVQGLKRADAVIIYGNGTPAALALNKLPAFRADLAPITDNSWTGRRVIAFAGIGRPQKFFSTLVSIGAQIVEAWPFGDHHTYTQTELAQLRDKASAVNATLVTTEKDFVRLTREEREGIVPLPVRVTFDDVEPLERLLDRLILRGLPPRAQ